MNDRNIYVTSDDRKRLQALLSRPTDAMDRDDVADLVAEVQRAVVVPASEIPPDVITMNSRARLLDLDQRTTLELTVVYPEDADFAAGRISVVAPIGAAMLGYRVGDEIEWVVPSGPRRLRVEAILYQPEAAGDFSR
ncbi:MAG TPA: nucleoside diphosphate kinase regulator [Thermoanaerobaculia bacterium]|nr:nucleoside diphosphate kinase regulator [Thermoanaerobaculia bacterium]HQN08150.1 nucleoside diphosphate kinase regulator [Thermoanaerobaculia bacterium]